MLHKIENAFVCFFAAGLWYTTRDDSPDETVYPEPSPRQAKTNLLKEVRNQERKLVKKLKSEKIRLKHVQGIFHFCSYFSLF